MAEITLSKIRWLLDMADPKIGNRPIAKITTQEVLAVLRSVEATGRYESARRMRSVLDRVFRYAVATTRAERDPTGDLRGALTREALTGSVPRTHRRFLSGSTSPAGLSNRLWSPNTPRLAGARAHWVRRRRSSESPLPKA